jgi:hypothetical protein
MVATLSEYDSRPGPVRDALATARRRWLRILEQQATIAQAHGDLPQDPPPELVAFEIDALLSSANVSRNLSDDTTHLDAARSLLKHRLAAPRASPRRKNAKGPNKTAAGDTGDPRTSSQRPGRALDSIDRDETQ